jgi:hypothetical protein
MPMLLMSGAEVEKDLHCVGFEVLRAVVMKSYIPGP